MKLTKKIITCTECGEKHAIIIKSNIWNKLFSNNMYDHIHCHECGYPIYFNIKDYHNACKEYYNK